MLLRTIPITSEDIAGMRDRSLALPACKEHRGALEHKGLSWAARPAARRWPPHRAWTIHGGRALEAAEPRQRQRAGIQALSQARAEARWSRLRHGVVQTGCLGASKEQAKPAPEIASRQSCVAVPSAASPSGVNVTIPKLPPAQTRCKQHRNVLLNEAVLVLVRLYDSPPRPAACESPASGKCGRGQSGSMSIQALSKARSGGARTMK